MPPCESRTICRHPFAAPCGVFAVDLRIARQAHTLPQKTFSLVNGTFHKNDKKISRKTVTSFKNIKKVFFLPENFELTGNFLSYYNRKDLKNYFQGANHVSNSRVSPYFSDIDPHDRL